MKSNYKKLGKYIRPVEIRNRNLEIENLIGLSIQKKFIPSISNTIGTDMSTYRILNNEQFAYCPVTSRNGEKITVALYQEKETAIISQAYDIFEIKDKSELLPEYLMMWFRRPEFDRYARFMSHGSVRELLGWEELCDVELPIPRIDKQREIVKEYNTILQRIDLNNGLIQKLEETAQAIYKQWFVDFEFPNENGEPYKSAGGEMVFDKDLEKEIPAIWIKTSLGRLLSPKGYIRGPFGSSLKKENMTESGVPVYEQQHAIDNHRDFRYFISEDKYKSLKRFTIKPNDFVISCSGTIGKIILIREDDPIGIINQALLILRPDTNKVTPMSLKYFLTSKDGNNYLVENSGGSAQVNIAKRQEIESIPLVLPPNINSQRYVSQLLQVCDDKVEILRKSNAALERLRNILLSKLATVTD